MTKAESEPRETTTEAEKLRTTAGGVAPAESATPSSSARRAAFWASRLLLVAVLGSGAVYGALWWQDRPLRQAEAAFRAGDFARTAALANFYLATHDGDVRAQVLKARALVEMGQADEALTIFETTSAADFDELHAWTKALLINQQWTRALPMLVRLQALQPKNADVLHEITTCRIRLGLLAEALDTAKQLAELPGQEARGLVLQAAVQNDLGDYKATLECYDRMFSYSPDALGLQLPPEEVFCQHGLVLINAGRPSEAVTSLQRSLALKPDPVAQIGLGKAYSQLGQIDAAIESWKQTLKIDPQNGAARESLANASLQKRDFKAAREWLEPLQNRPEMPSSTAYLFQRVWTLSGDKEAGQLWEKRAEKIREREELASKIDETLLRAPYAFWTSIVRVHQFAAAGNWKQAEDMLRELPLENVEDPFIAKLKQAIRDRSELPPLSELPIQ